MFILWLPAVNSMITSCLFHNYQRLFFDYQMFILWLPAVFLWLSDVYSIIISYLFYDYQLFILWLSDVYSISRESLREEKENQEKDEKPLHPFSLLHAKLDQGLLGIRSQLPVNQQQLFPPGFSVDSPLQRMASITNSLVSQPLPSPNFGQRPLKAVLPPITQQQVNTQV